MFEKITKKIFDKAKVVAKDEIKTTIDTRMPDIITYMTIGFAILSVVSSTNKEKIRDGGITIINNYYYK